MFSETNIVRSLGARSTFTAGLRWSAGTSAMGGSTMRSTWPARMRLSRVAASGTIRKTTVS